MERRKTVTRPSDSDGGNSRKVDGDGDGEDSTVCMANDGVASFIL